MLCLALWYYIVRANVLVGKVSVIKCQDPSRMIALLRLHFDGHQILCSLMTFVVPLLWMKEGNRNMLLCWVFEMVECWFICLSIIWSPNSDMVALKVNMTILHFLPTSLMTHVLSSFLQTLRALSMGTTRPVQSSLPQLLERESSLSTVQSSALLRRTSRTSWTP